MGKEGGGGLSGHLSRKHVIESLTKHIVANDLFDYNGRKGFHCVFDPYIMPYNCQILKCNS